MLQSGFERMVVRMIDLTTKLVHVVHEYSEELLLFFITQRERHRALSFVEPSGLRGARRGRAEAGDFQDLALVERLGLQERGGECDQLSLMLSE